MAPGQTAGMRALPILFALVLAGCVHSAPTVCQPGGRAMLTAELFFGRKTGERLIGEDAWRRFLDQEVTPRFPNGFTVFDAAGQWRDTERGTLVREPSRVVLIALPDEPEGRERLRLVAEAYKRRFNQQSVGTILRPGCVSF